MKITANDTTVKELLVSSSPEELATSQHRMILCVELKRDAALVEAKNAHDLLEQCVSAKLSVPQAKAMHKRATARVTFLSNMIEALKAGYVMMPDMPGEVVMVRTDRKYAVPSAQRGHSYRSNVPYVQPQGLPAGEGRYVKHEHDTRAFDVPDGVDTKGNTKWVQKWRGAGFLECDGLPMKFVRPKIVRRVADACELKVFDEVVCIGHQDVARRKCKDPIVLGRIFNPVTKTVAAFLIAHFIDTAEL